jgi:hypothetical protein
VLQSKQVDELCVWWVWDEVHFWWGWFWRRDLKHQMQYCWDLNTPSENCLREGTCQMLLTCNRVFSSCLRSANFAAAWRCAGVCVSSTRTRSCNNTNIKEMKQVQNKPTNNLLLIFI